MRQGVLVRYQWRSCQAHLPVNSSFTHLFLKIFRKNSEISIHFSADERASKLKRGSLRGTTLNKTPKILLTDYDQVNENAVSSQTLNLRRSKSESSLTDVEKVDKFPGNQEVALSGSSSSENVPDVVRIDIEGSQSSENPSQATQGTLVSSGTLASSYKSTSFSDSTDRHTSSDGERVAEKFTVPSRDESAHKKGESQDSLPRVNFLTGMAKTFHQWRTKTKKKRKFNYEKYIIYLESILPTVGFSIGGVIITFNGIYTFIVVLTFLVGVFAQEAFFGN